MTKKQLRQIFLKKRAALIEKEVATLSKKISMRLSKIDDFKNSQIFSVYIPINNEVDTKLLIDKLTQQGKTVTLPRYFKNSKKYNLVPFEGWHKLEVGPFSIPQSTNTNIIDPARIEVAILPGVAFDNKGVRLGYGKGVFDQLLVKSMAEKIGLAYDFQIVDALPEEQHDLLMDLIVTEKRVLDFDRL